MSNTKIDVTQIDLPGSPGDLLASDGTAVTVGSGLTLAGGTLTSTGGTVTTVTASAPLASSGGATPDISLTGVVDVANGGTGISTLTTAANILVAQNATTLSSVAVSGDATLSTAGAVTVTGLQTSPVSASAPTAGQFLGWTGAAWAPADVTGGGGFGPGFNYYLEYATAATAPAPASSSLMDFSYSTDPQSNTGPVTVPDSTTQQTLATFVSDPGNPGDVTIPAGLWDLAFYASSTGASNETSFRFLVQTWDGSTATTIATSDDVYITGAANTINQYTASAFVPLTDLTGTERLIIVVEGRRWVSNSHSITGYFQGNTISHVHTTLSAPGGTGVVKVLNGVIQTPASLIVNADVDNAAAIAQSKIANLTTDLASKVSSVGATAPITSSGGTAPTIGITAATTLAAGSMSAADKAKLDGISAGASIGGSVAVNQVAYGSGANTIQGSSSFTYDGTKLTVTGSGSILELVDSIDGLFFETNSTFYTVSLLDPLGSGARVDLSSVNGVIAQGSEVKLTKAEAPSTNRLISFGDDGTGKTALKTEITTDGGVTFNPDTLRFQTADWDVNGNSGAAGEVLTSNGAGTAPTWQALSGIGGSIAVDQIAFGTGVNTIGGGSNIVRNAVSGGLDVVHPGFGSVSIELAAVQCAGAGGGTLTISTSGLSGRITPGVGQPLDLILTSSLEISGNSGSVGEVLISQGSGLPPVWGPQAASGAAIGVYTAVSSAYSIDVNTDYAVDCTSGTFTVTLPTAVGISGRIFVIKNSGTGVISVNTTSGQTIDGAGSLTISTQYASFTVMSTGANWIII